MAKPDVSRSLRGRQREALANDDRILAAAKALLTSNPRASMADIAAHAGVGVASLYRRFPSKDDLARRLCRDTMNRIATIAEEATRRGEEDPWASFAAFLHDAIAAGAGSLRALAGTFRAGADVNAVAEEMNSAIERLLFDVQAAGAVRADLTAQDVTMVFEMLNAIYVGNDTRRAALRDRYLALIMASLSSDAATPLDAPPPTWDEIVSAWNPRSGA